VRNLRDLAVEEVGVGPELRRPGLEGVPRPRAVVEEEEEDGLVRQEPRRLAAMKLRLEVLGRIKEIVDLLRRQVLRLDVTRPVSMPISIPGVLCAPANSRCRMQNP
jgi:hypothetical protein